MKILPISNTFNIQKSISTFKADISPKKFDYTSMDSYVDKTGLHYVSRNTPFPWIEHNNNIPKRTLSIKENVFLTQEQYDEKIHSNIVSNVNNKSRNYIKDLLYDLNIEGVSKELDKLDYYNRSYVTKQPFFALGLADIPLNETNKELFQNVLNKIPETNGRPDININVMDENGITLLEKVMNAENEPLLETIIEKSEVGYISTQDIAYDQMQKYAFNNIQNTEFKEKCKNLPIKFYDIIEDVKSKDLISLDKHVNEQMKCGFCDIEYAFLRSISDQIHAENFSTFGDCCEFTKTVFNTVQKHFPREIRSIILKHYFPCLYR